MNPNKTKTTTIIKNYPILLKEINKITKEVKRECLTKSIRIIWSATTTVNIHIRTCLSIYDAIVRLPRYI
jgi:hypothetical protein